MNFVHPKFLTISSLDSKKQRPATEWISKSFFHPKSRRIYRVIGFVWDSSNDEWKVHYSRAGCTIQFTRVMSEFKEKFVQIEDESAPNEDDY